LRAGLGRRFGLGRRGPIRLATESLKRGSPVSVFDH
jgi:hypothetical protein